MAVNLIYKREYRAKFLLLTLKHFVVTSWSCSMNCFLKKKSVSARKFEEKLQSECDESQVSGTSSWVWLTFSFQEKNIKLWVTVKIKVFVREKDKKYADVFLNLHFRGPYFILFFADGDWGDWNKSARMNHCIRWRRSKNKFGEDAAEGSAHVQNLTWQHHIYFGNLLGEMKKKNKTTKNKTKQEKTPASPFFFNASKKTIFFRVIMLRHRKWEATTEANLVYHLPCCAL